MDPERALLDLRELCSDLLNETTAPGTAERVAELFQGLDGWITGGGFLPRSWMGVH